LPKRTFADCLRAIEDAFDIQISSDARNGYRYRIVNREWLEKDNVKDWLLSAFAVNGLLQDSKGLRDRVMYEEIPSGNEYLLKILGAMKKDNVIRISYQDFYDTAPHEIDLEPYCVRVFRQRWYVIGVMRNIPDWEEASEMTNQGNIRRYALDRIKYLEVTDETFKMPVHFSAESYFANAFGIIVEPEKYKVERIRLKVTDINHRRQYIRSLPLHDSQREVERYDDYSIFELQVMPAYDFIQQILAMSSEVEVLSPENVREEIARWVKEIAELYC
jgi:predicted DNA-binding transcriptional regulator YafY